MIICIYLGSLFQSNKSWTRLVALVFIGSTTIATAVCTFLLRCIVACTGVIYSAAIFLSFPRVEWERKRERDHHEYELQLTICDCLPRYISIHGELYFLDVSSRADIRPWHFFVMREEKRNRKAKRIEPTIINLHAYVCASAQLETRPNH